MPTAGTALSLLKETLRRWEPWLGLTLCAVLVVTWVTGELIASHPAYADALGVAWLPLPAAALAAAAFLVRVDAHPASARVCRPLTWGALLVAIWAAGGLLIDLLRVAALLAPGLMPVGVDWAGLVTRALALAIGILLAHQALRTSGDGAQTVRGERGARARWYAVAAFALALPYPLLKTFWALGGSAGLLTTGAGGHLSDGAALHRLALWLPAVPWLLAAALSLLLVRPRRGVPRRLLLTAGWSAAAVVASFAPAACVSLLGGLATGDAETGDIAPWVFALVYGSWFLWLVAAAAATRSYQLRTAR
jgi:hypothetical protein